MADTVRPYESGDKYDVLQICEKVWGSEDRFCLDFLWDWKHGRDASPANKERQCSRVLLRNGKIVGYSGMIPAEFMMEGKKAYGGAILDLYVDPDARGAGLKLMKLQIADCGIAYGFALSRTHDTFSKLLKRENCVIKIIEKRYLFLDATSILSRKLPRPLARTLGLAWKLYASARNRLNAPKMPDGWSIEEVSQFTQAIDSVWERFAGQFRYSMTRTAEYLNWRFGSTPYAYEKRLLLGRGEISGCIIFRKALLNGEPVVIICEAFATGPIRQSYSLLLHEVYKYAVQARANRIGAINTGCKYFKEALDKMGFLSRVHAMPVIGSWVDNPKDSDKIYDKSGWYISPADTEIEHALFDQLSRNALEYAKHNGAVSQRVEAIYSQVGK